MNTENFLKLLERRELLPPRIVAKVRDMLQRGDHRLTSEALLKYLVQRELIGHRTAKQLLETVLKVDPQAESSILGQLPPAAGPPEPEPPVLELGATNSHAPEPPKEGPVLGFTIGAEDAPTADGVEEEVLSIVPEEEDSEKEPVDLFETPDTETPDTQGSKSGPTPPSEPEDLFADMMPGMRPPEKEKKRDGRKRRKQNEWDSPLLLIGGGGLVALLVGGLFIGYLLNREDADQILKQAAAYFDSGSYTQAIAQYQKFVAHFPHHPQASAAKVRLGIARIWKATQGTRQYGQALQTAQQVLEKIEEEPEFGQAQEDLASLLPAIATGLAEQAEQATAPEAMDLRVKQAKSAVSLWLNTKYISKTYRDENALRDVQATLARVERRRRQDADLQQALEQIDLAITASKTTEAYSIRKKLLKNHPGLSANQRLAAKVLEISQAELKGIRYVSESVAALTGPHPSPVLASLALAERRGLAAAQVSGNLAVTVDGAVYGLRASDGGLLWRRFLGLQSRTAPVALEGGDVLVLDSRYHELLRLDGATGKIRWRQPLASAAARPVLAGGRILVAAASGKLWVVDPTSGKRAGYVQFSQPLIVPPTTDRQQKRIYVVGEQSSFYTLDAKDFSCLGVFYLGHARSSLRVAPVALLNKVAVAVNTGAATSQLRLLGTDDSGVIKSVVAHARLQGLVSTRLLTAGRRLVVLTSQGLVAVYEIGSGEDSTALTLLAQRDAIPGEPVARYGLLQQEPANSQWNIWVAGTKLNQMAILPTGGRLPVGDIDQNYSGDRFDHPLQMAGKLLVHVRRPAGQSGAIVAAMDSKTGNAGWETELAVPLAGEPVVDLRGPRITAATATGAIYEMDRAAMSRRVQDQALHRSPFSGNQSQGNQGQAAKGLPLTESVVLGAGEVVFAAGQGARQWLLYQRNARPDPVRRIALASPSACPPVAWGDGVVAATRIGQIFYFEATAPEGAKGSSVYIPFQPLCSRALSTRG